MTRSKSSPPQPPKRGRPRKPKAELTKQTAFRLTPDARKKIRLLAEHWECSQAGAVERAADEACRRIIGAPGE